MAFPTYPTTRYHVPLPDNTMDGAAMRWLLIGYMFLFIDRPFEVWPWLGDLHIERLYMLRRDLLRLRNAALPLVEVCRRLTSAELPQIHAAMHPLFRDVTDHIRTVQEKIDSLREVLAFAFEASLLVGQSQETAISKKLASWAAILAVPTAFAGIYGMNFDDMPELKMQYGYPIVLVSIAFICTFLYWRFRKNGWL